MSTELAQLLDNRFHIISLAGGSVDATDEVYVDRVEFLYVIVDAQQRIEDILPMQLRGITQHRDLRQRAECIAQTDGIVDDACELRMSCGLAVSCKRQYIGMLTVGSHLPQRCFQCPRHLLACRTG